MNRSSPFLLGLRASAFYTGLGVVTVLCLPVMLALIPLPYRARYGLVAAWVGFNLLWLKLTCGLGFRVEGRDNIPREPAIVMCKHQSAWETLAVNLLFQPQVWVLKRELLRVPVLGWGMATLRPIAIDRSAGAPAVRQVLAQGAERLRQGCWVVIFPEGTRVAPGSRGRYRSSAARLAASTGRPVVPVAHNAGDYWPRNGFVKLPGTIRMVVGPTIETDGKSAATITAEAEEWIEKTVQKLRIDDGFETAPSYQLSNAEPQA